MITETRTQPCSFQSGHSKIEVFPLQGGFLVTQDNRLRVLMRAEEHGEYCEDSFNIWGHKITVDFYGRAGENRGSHVLYFSSKDVGAEDILGFYDMLATSDSDSPYPTDVKVYKYEQGIIPAYIVDTHEIGDVSIWVGNVSLLIQYCESRVANMLLLRLWQHEGLTEEESREVVTYCISEFGEGELQ